MEIDGKEIIMMAAIGLTGLMFGAIFGFFVGAWAGSINGYDTGIEAGINYANCLIEKTPLYSEVTDRVIQDCWETYVYDSY